MIESIDGLAFIKDQQFDDYAFLFGNGLFLSHPKEDIQNAYKIESSKYSEIILKIQDLLAPLMSGKKDICPEKFLNYFYNLYGLEIFQIYIEQHSKITEKAEGPTDFLKSFKSIYTTNYDINTYKFIFSKSSRPYPFKDGFFKKNNKVEFEYKEISDNLSNEGIQGKPFHYLHGAFFIFHKEKNKKCFKEESNKSQYISDVLIDKYKELTNKYLNYIKQENTDTTPFIEDNPVLVFSGRTIYKDATIENDDYLKLCFKNLSSEKKIFTFGCSYILDKHIIDHLLKGSNKEIYLGFYDECDRQRIDKHIESSPKSNKQNHIIKFVDLKTNDQEIQKIICGGSYFKQQEDLERLLNKLSVSSD